MHSVLRAVNILLVMRSNRETQRERETTHADSDTAREQHIDTYGQYCL
jgi:hypothetical protein